MKNVPRNLPADQAAKELKTFAIAGLLLGVISLFLLWWLSIAGIAASARAIMLSTNKNISGAAETHKYKIMGIIGLIVSLSCLLLVQFGR